VSGNGSGEDSTVRNRRSSQGAYLAIGAGIGAAIGSAIGNVAVGIGVGIAIGAAIGAASSGPGDDEIRRDSPTSHPSAGTGGQGPSPTDDQDGS
jgi:uncharacterized protein YcfJ